MKSNVACGACVRSPRHNMLLVPADSDARRNTCPELGSWDKRSPPRKKKAPRLQPLPMTEPLPLLQPLAEMHTTSVHAPVARGGAPRSAPSRVQSMPIFCLMLIRGTPFDNNKLINNNNHARPRLAAVPSHLQGRDGRHDWRLRLAAELAQG